MTERRTPSCRDATAHLITIGACEPKYLQSLARFEVNPALQAKVNLAPIAYVVAVAPVMGSLTTPFSTVSASHFTSLSNTVH